MTRSGAIACAFLMEGAKELAPDPHNLNRQNARMAKKKKAQYSKEKASKHITE